ncbi:hypothetical protein RDWZM_003976 [Blomia tropicalis]|uniref:Uncharacterized protein n=1 Tax=Blomia tropicalis TaxID=40697 RepID=A0A9Q0RTI5_BLOTA|nr:hypothetical protein RDWZM_003976 [Blomia tropicalis]
MPTHSPQTTSALEYYGLFKIDQYWYQLIIVLLNVIGFKLYYINTINNISNFHQLKMYKKIIVQLALLMAIFALVMTDDATSPTPTGTAANVTNTTDSSTTPTAPVETTTQKGGSFSPMINSSTLIAVFIASLFALYRH